MKKLLSFAAIAAVFATLSFGTANAGDRDFVLHNHTRYNIVGMNVASPGYVWKRVSNVFVPPGSSQSITIYNDDSDCQLGFEVFWPAGFYSTFNAGFDFCSATDITIFESGGVIHAQAE